MLIVELNGGLGNQMFQYALYKKLLSMNKEVYLYDAILTKKLNNPSSVKIFDVFDLDDKICDKHECYVRADVRRDIFSRLRRRIFGKRKFRTNYIETDFDNNYDMKIFNLNDAYIQGYWQSELYFREIKDKIRKEFSFSYIDMCEIGDILNKIDNTNSVSIHVRRGDYVGNPIYSGICTKEYYEKAICKIYDRISEPFFFIFSDDIEYVKGLFRNKNFYIVNKFNGMEAHYDMFLMSKCQHNILANSSFSWWGAWLNDHKDKMVISPKRWANTIELRHTPCKDWIRI